MDEAVYAKIKLNVKKLLNIDLNQYKAEQMQRRLDSWLVRSGIASWDEYVKIIATDSKELSKFRDYLTINVSEFFRDQDRWNTLKSKVIPDLVKDANFKTEPGAKGTLRIWSAGCSNGSEPYSLAIMLDEITTMKTSHYILATDLDRSILTRARARGPYSADDTRNVNSEQRGKYFDAGGPPYFVKDLISKRVTFKEHNLLLDPFEKNFDLIVCRNVIIYFTLEAKAELYQKFHSSLRPGGILFLGGTEIIPRPSEIGFINMGGSYYQKDSR
jgi:chemotaxis protein methyltransferase CheR